MTSDTSPWQNRRGRRVGNVLVLDGDADFRKRVTEALWAEGHHAAGAERLGLALEMCGQQAFDVVVLGTTTDGTREDFFSKIKSFPHPPRVVCVATENDGLLLQEPLVSTSVERNADPATLRIAVRRCLERTELREDAGAAATEHNVVAWSRRQLALLENPDLEWLQERVLAELTVASGAQSAALWLREAQDFVLKAYRGLVDVSSLKERIESHAALEQRLKEGKAWRSDGRPPVVFLPLVAYGEAVGLVQLSDPLVDEFEASKIAHASVIGEFAAVGIRIGKRVLELQRIGLRDRETAAYNLSYFTDYASKEIYKARRYGRVFSMLTFSVDGLSQVVVKQGTMDARRAVRGIIRVLARVVRDADVIARAGEHEFYLLFPETDYFGALMFLRRAMVALEADAEIQEINASVPLNIVGAAATFPRDGEDFDELIWHCRRRMEARRSSLRRTLLLERLSFWEEVEVLLGNSQSPRLPTDERAPASRRGRVAEGFFPDLQGEVAAELLRHPRARGLVYLGVPEVTSELPLARHLEMVPPDYAFRAYVLGRRGNMGAHVALTPVFVEGDENLARYAVLLWLSESAAYGMIQRTGGGAPWGFHTSDSAVVESLIGKLQVNYDLQPF